MEQKTIELLPAQMVYTRKAGTDTRRSRAICCGSYSETRFNSDCYTGGADGCQVRALLRTAALKKWAVAATDIRVAFLNAPRRDDGRLVAMEIPAVYRRLGLAREGDVWLVRLAMYGLTTSPRDWSQYRDATLPQITWTRSREGREVKGVFNKTADENLEETDQISGQKVWSGLMSVYVDDILLSGEEEAVSAALQSLSSTWATSSVEWASTSTPVHFCGFEVTVDEEGNGLHISQRKYEQELLARWAVGEPLAFPHFKVTEEDLEQRSEVDRTLVREAQALAGSLLWLSTRSRPDLAFGVAAVSRLVTRNPSKAIEIAHVLLAYIKNTPGDLHYPQEVKEKWGVRGQLKVQRHGRLLEVFADIAYGSGTGHRSMQGLVLCFAGAPIAWQSSTQPFVTHSTAESELVSYCEALTAGRATEALLCAIWGEPLQSNNNFERVIYGDNVAAIGLAHGNSSILWRTRHLRVRSNIPREALEDQSSYPGGPWKLFHLRGTELVADGMTKPLAGQRFAGFLSDLGMKAGGATMKKVTVGGQAHALQDHHGGALRALIAGGMMVRMAEAQGDQDRDPIFDRLWMCGIVLVIVGAIWVAKAACMSVQCCLKRLHIRTSEPHQIDADSEEEDGRGSRRPRTTRTPTRTQEEEEDSLGSTSLRLRRPRVTRTPTRLKRDESDEAAEASCTTEEEDAKVVAAAAETLKRRSQQLSGTSSRPSRTLDTLAEVTNDVEKAAVSAQLAAKAADQAAERVEKASARLQHGVHQSGQQKNRTVDLDPANPWNRFQHQHSGKGWSAEKMRAEYYKQRRTAFEECLEPHF